MIDRTVTQDLYFCSLSEKACVTLLCSKAAYKCNVPVQSISVSCPGELSREINSLSIAGGTAENTNISFTVILFNSTLASNMCSPKNPARCHMLLQRFLNPTRHCVYSLYKTDFLPKCGVMCSLNPTRKRFFLIQ